MSVIPSQRLDQFFGSIPAYDNGNTMHTDEIHIGTTYESVTE